MFFTATVRCNGEREESFSFSPFLKEESLGVQRNPDFLTVFRKRSSLWVVCESGSVVIGFMFEVSQLGVPHNLGGGSVTKDEGRQDWQDWRGIFRILCLLCLPQAWL